MHADIDVLLHLGLLLEYLHAENTAEEQRVMLLLDLGVTFTLLLLLFLLLFLLLLILFLNFDGPGCVQSCLTLTCASDLKLGTHLEGVHSSIFCKKNFLVRLELVPVLNGLT